MGRGRSINRTLPPTRSLTAQRDYRARKTAHLKELEETVARLTEENQALRAEVYDLRARIASPDELPPSQLDAAVAARQQLVKALDSLDCVIGGPAEERPSLNGYPSWAENPDTHPWSRDTAVQVPTWEDAQRQRPWPIRAVSDVADPSRDRSSSSSRPSPDQQSRRQTSPPTTVSLAIAPPSSSIGDIAVPAPADTDPECCFGLFDCSDPLKVMIASSTALPVEPPEPVRCQGGECTSEMEAAESQGRGRHCLRS